MNRRLLFFVNDTRFFVSHRMPIALEAMRRGYHVAVVSPPCAASAVLEAAGIRHLPLGLPRGKISPWAELRAVLGIFGIFRRERPDLVHLITAKPIIYGGIAARLLRIPAVAAVPGMGHLFITDTVKSRIQRFFAVRGYRFALRRKGAFALFQNHENMRLMQNTGALREKPTTIAGSGVDITRFDPSPRTGAGTVCFVLPARMLASKGVREFVEAARMLRLEGSTAEFWLAGDVDPPNPDSLTEQQLRAWHDAGDVTWLGYRPDIENVLRDADVVVLPSYGEGFPKSLVDAAAAGRPVVTTDVLGCRDAIVVGETGLLVAPRDATSLAAAMRRLGSDPKLRVAMGAAGRQLAEREYAIERIVQQHFDLFDAILGAQAT